LAQGWVRAGTCTCVFEGRYFFIIFALLDASKCDMMKTGTKEKIFFVQFGQAGFYWNTILRHSQEPVIAHLLSI